MVVRGVPHACYAIRTYPVAEDIISTTDSSVQTEEGVEPPTVVNLSTEGDLEELMFRWWGVGRLFVLLIGIFSPISLHSDVSQ